MPRFAFTFEFDVPHFVDFVLEADSQEHAETLAKRLLQEGELDAVLSAHTQPSIEGASGDRVRTLDYGKDCEAIDTLQEFAESDGRQVSGDFPKWVEEARIK